MANSAKAKGVPEGTETEEWRVMSARIAFLLWTDKARAALPAETVYPPASWAEHAAGFRADVRHALRLAEKEGVRFRRDTTLAISVGSELWHIHTARISWLLWMRRNRQSGRVPREEELTIWNNEALDYRKYVRSTAEVCAGEGIHLQL